MKAVLCRAFGPLAAVRIEEAQSPAPGPGQALIRVHACGINFFDGLMVEGKYQVRPPFPFAPGAEISGVVTALGAGVSAPAIGTRVLAFTGHGGLCEEVAVDTWRIFPIPAGMDDATAAAFPIVYATSYHALKDRAQLRSGETLLVLGAAGGVGLTAVELGKLLGARVIAAASSAEKLELCRRYGADALINYSSEDLRERVKAVTGGQGADVVYDPVGGPYSEPAVRSLAMDGRLLVIGFAAGDIPRLPLNLLLLKSAAAVGVFWGAFAQARPAQNAANVHQLLEWFQAGKLRPHRSGSYPLARFRDAIETVVQRRAQGKVVVLMPVAGG